MQSPQLKDLGEHKLIRRIHDLVHGRTNAVLMLDDAAIARGHCAGCATWITTDPSPIPSLVQRIGMGQYYHSGWLSAVKSLSDIAAMGARPTGVLVAVEFPAETACSDFDAFFEGVIDCCAQHGTALLGGNLKESFGSCHAVSCALGVTASEGALLRGRPNPGDVLFVVDREELGGFWAGIATHVKPRECSIASETALSHARQIALTPKAKLAQGQALLRTGGISFCMDNSDGILASAIELVASSDVDVLFDLCPDQFSPTVRTIASAAGADVCSWALGWGSYDLLCAAPTSALPAIRRVLAELGSEMVLVGRIDEGHGAVSVNGMVLSPCTPAAFRGDQFLDGAFWQTGPEKYLQAMMSLQLQEIVHGAV